MADPPVRAELLGDLLALARASWVRQMGERLARLGYRDYRRSDALAVRVLHRPRPVGELGQVMGVSRQAARKLAEGLEERGYAVTVRDGQDARRVNVTLTPEGRRYALAVVEVIHALNSELDAHFAADQLAVTKTVLRRIADNGPR